MALEQTLKDITGTERVFDQPQILEMYSKDESFVKPIRPRCIVKPKNTEEVQEIVKWANDNRTPLLPVSSGPIHFHGDTVPSVGGVVIVDLSEMKRIIRVDRRNRVAMIEPGVTFGELIPALEKEELAPFMPLLPRESKSVLTSWLERTPMTVPKHHWETQDPFACAEVVYGSGDYFRTGSAAGPGTIEEQWEVGRAQMRGQGPGNLDFGKLLQAAQGTMGIVTWATIKCKILPVVKKTFFVPSENLERMIDFVYRLLWKRLGNEYIILNAHNFACMREQDEASIRKLRDDLPPWVFIFSIDGIGVLPQDKVEYQQAEFMELAKEHGLNPVSSLAGISAEEVSEALSRPSPELYWRLRYQGGCHDIFFLTTLDKTSQFINKMHDLAQSFRYPTTDIGVYLQPTLHGTNCHCEFNLSYNPQNVREVDRGKALDREACLSLANIGGFFSRPYGQWANIVYGRDAATVVALRKIKGIFDPNGIMNPGKLCF